MSKVLLQDLEYRKAHLVDEATKIAACAAEANRSFTPTETAKLRVCKAEITGLSATIEECRTDVALFDAIRENDREIFGGQRHANASAVKSWGNAYARQYGAYGTKDALTPSGTITAPALSADLAPRLHARNVLVGDDVIRAARRTELPVRTRNDSRIERGECSGPQCVYGSTAAAVVQM